MKNAIQWIKERPYCLILLYWPIHFLWYDFLRILHPADGTVWIVESPLDRMIPFCEWFAIPYYLWYLWLVFTMVYPLVASTKEDFLRTQALVLGVVLIPMVICTVIPNGIPMALRPNFEELGRDNFAVRMVEWIYSVDTPPRNVFPSMHVSVSWGMLFSLWQSPRLGKILWLRIASVILAVLVSMATVMIKQHSVLDVAAGMATACLVFSVVFLWEKRTKKRKAEKILAEKENGTSSRAA